MFSVNQRSLSLWRKNSVRDICNSQFKKLFPEFFINNSAHIRPLHQPIIHPLALQSKVVQIKYQLLSLTHRQQRINLRSLHKPRSNLIPIVWFHHRVHTDNLHISQLLNKIIHLCIAQILRHTTQCRRPLLFGPRTSHHKQANKRNNISKLIHTKNTVSNVTKSNF